MTTNELIHASEPILEKHNSVVGNCTQQLRKLIIEYNNNDILYESANQTIKLNEASIEQIKFIISEIKMGNDRQIREQQQSAYREIQTKLNKYGPDNEYGK